MDDGNVVVPITWVLGIIGTLGTVIGVMAREFFKLQNNRVAETRSDTVKVITALNENTNALNKLSDSLVSGDA